MNLTVLTAIAIVLLIVAVILLSVKLRSTIMARSEVQAGLSRLTARFQGVADADAERTRVLAQLEQERTAQRAVIERDHIVGAMELDQIRLTIQTQTLSASDLAVQVRALQAQFASLEEEANLQSFGVYKPRYDFADSVRYENALEAIRDRQKQMLKDRVAAVCAVEWTVSGSKADGRKSTYHTLKLMLRAFNGECDAAITKVKYNNVHVMEARIQKAHEMINSLAVVQQCSIVRGYLDLKLEELYLAHEFQEQLQAEKEEQRRIREQMRDEEIALRELEKARADAEKEAERYEQALLKARQDVERAVGAKQEKLLSQIEELQRRLAEAQANKERAIARAQLTRSGHVYIISNIGSFGEHVYKIGMTRRLDPYERIRELGDASVPFCFDVHAVIYCEDAPTLENKLHRVFDDRRVNRVNERKEFFSVGIHEIADAVKKHDCAIEMTLAAEAAEFRKTQGIIDEERRRLPPPAIGSLAVYSPLTARLDGSVVST